MNKWRHLSAGVLAYRQSGQSVTETLLITLVLVAGFWGYGWMRGEQGLVALLVSALMTWHQRFSSLLALPV